jgi:hypothetical protein
VEKQSSFQKHIYQTAVVSAWGIKRQELQLAMLANAGQSKN